MSVNGAIPPGMWFQAANKRVSLLAGQIQSGWRFNGLGEGNRFVLAVAAAVMLHVVALWIALGGGPASLASARLTGDPAGRDGINVETIDATEFERQFLSFKAGSDATDSDPAARSENSAQAPEPSVAPVMRPSLDVITTESIAAVQTAPAPDRLPATSSSPAPPLSAEDIEQIVAGAHRELKDVAATLSTAGSARLGEASPFIRGVLRILKQSMPSSNGMRGNVAIQLLVSGSGDVEAIRLAQGSGNPALDRLVMERVRSTHLIPPAKDTPPRERLFKINYIYQ